MNDPRTHPLHVRAGHWIDAFAVCGLLCTGFAMFVTDRKFAAIAHAVPAWLTALLTATSHGPASRAWHLALAIVLMANAAWYAVAALRGGTFRRLLPGGRGFARELASSMLAEIRSPRESLRRRDYPAVQRIAYLGVFVLAATMIVTGIALWFGRQLPWLTAALGGQRIVLPLHVAVATLLLLFIVVHVVQVLRCGTAALLSMIAGSPTLTPAAKRRSAIWAGASVAAVALLVTGARMSAGPNGVPPYLAWTMQRHAAHGLGGDANGDASGHRSDSNGTTMTRL